jgi:hypothetical protein
MKKYRLPRKKKKKLLKHLAGRVIYDMLRNPHKLDIMRNIFKSDVPQELLNYPSTPDECYTWKVNERYFGGTDPY